MSFVYEQAAEIIDKWNSNKGGIKSLCFSKKVKCNAAIYCLCCETLKYSNVINELLTEGVGAKLAEEADSENIRVSMLHVMIYDLLFGSKKISGGGKIKKIVMKYADDMKNWIASLLVKHGLSSTDLLLPESLRIDPMILLPRFIRVNTLCWSMDDCDLCLEKEYSMKKCHYDPFKPIPEVGTYYVDPHVPYVLVLSREQKQLGDNTPWHKHPLIQSGKLILQDKASCMPPFVLMQHSFNDNKVNISENRYLWFLKGLDSPLLCDQWFEGSRYLELVNVAKERSKLFTDYCSNITIKSIDACAAPGNKTSFLAALMELNNMGNEIFACEIDKYRHELLAKRMKDTFADRIVKAKNIDFLSINPNDILYKDVTMMVVDPSCSSSGLINQSLDQRLKWATPTQSVIDAEKDKVNSLASFQASIVSHAMKFPGVARLTYSTCSIHVEENENVVQKVLEINPDFELVPALPEWHQRGLNLFPNSDFCIRCNPETDLMHGFFVALFQRKDIDTYVPKSIVSLPEIIASTSSPLKNAPAKVRLNRRTKRIKLK